MNDFESGRGSGEQRKGIDPTRERGGRDGIFSRRKTDDRRAGPTIKRGNRNKGRTEVFSAEKGDLHSTKTQNKVWRRTKKDHVGLKPLGMGLAPADDYLVPPVSTLSRLPVE